MNSKINDQRLACKVMGINLTSTDRFIRRAIEWLGVNCNSFTMERTEDHCWIIRSDKLSAGDDTLAGAICGAVFCQDAINHASDDGV